ncbi:hypothetical protein [Microbacterium sp.]|uniref:hypothetical protein n=1 Tax=Microbacterium sp. TaxID=51671 RepID=UPI003221A1CB
MRRFDEDLDVADLALLVLGELGVEEEIVGDEVGEGVESSTSGFRHGDHPSAEQAVPEHRQPFVDREVRSDRPRAARRVDASAGSHGERRGKTVEPREHGVQPTRRDDDVCVEVDAGEACGDLVGGVERPGLSRVGSVDDDDSSTRGDLSRPIRASVRTHDDLDLAATALREQRIEARGDDRLFVVSGDDHAHHVVVDPVIVSP